METMIIKLVAADRYSFRGFVYYKGVHVQTSRDSAEYLLNTVNSATQEKYFEVCKPGPRKPGRPPGSKKVAAPPKPSVPYVPPVITATEHDTTAKSQAAKMEEARRAKEATPVVVGADADISIPEVVIPNDSQPNTPEEPVDIGEKI